IPNNANDNVPAFLCHHPYSCWRSTSRRPWNLCWLVGPPTTPTNSSNISPNRRPPLALHHTSTTTMHLSLLHPPWAHEETDWCVCVCVCVCRVGVVWVSWCVVHVSWRVSCVSCRV